MLRRTTFYFRKTVTWRRWNRSVMRPYFHPTDVRRIAPQRSTFVTMKLSATEWLSLSEWQRSTAGSTAIRSSNFSLGTVTNSKTALPLYLDAPQSLPACLLAAAGGGPPSPNDAPNGAHLY